MDPHKAIAAQEFGAPHHHHPALPHEPVDTIRVEVEAGPHLLDLIAGLGNVARHPFHGLTEGEAAHLLGRLKHLRTTIHHALHP